MNIMKQNITEYLTQYNFIKSDNIKEYITYENYTITNNDKIKINVYNIKLDHPSHKIWLYIPEVKIINIFQKDDKPSSLKVSFSPSASQNLLDFVNLIEKDCQMYALSNELIDGQYNVKYSINSNWIPMLVLQISQGVFFNLTGDSLEIHDLKKNTNMGLYIELDTVYIDKNKHLMGFNWKILQGKIIPEIDFSLCLFELDTDIVPSINIQPIQYMQPIQPIQPIFTQNINIDKPKFSLSLSDLQNGIKSLKKINNIPSPKPIIIKPLINTLDLQNGFAALKKVNITGEKKINITGEIKVKKKKKKKVIHDEKVE